MKKIAISQFSIALVLTFSHWVVGCRRDTGASSQVTPASQSAITGFLVHFYESTGDNLFLKVGEREVPITFHNSSSPEARAAFEALTYEVLNPNSDSKITFYGFFVKEATFCLKDWKLQTPFTKLVPSLDPIEAPKLKIVEHLDRSCFLLKNGFDPFASEFDPRQHEERRDVHISK